MSELYGKDLERAIVNSIKETNDIWKAIEIAQHYNNSYLYDRVLDNILKWGVVGILEKPNRIFYGDNTKLFEIPEEEVSPSKPHKFEGTEVGNEYDTVLEISAQIGLSCFNSFLSRRVNRKLIVKQVEVKMPNPSSMKKTKESTEVLKRALELIGIQVDGDELFEYEGKLVATHPYSVTIYTME